MAACWSRDTAAPVRAVVCHCNACSLAEVQPCFTLPIALAAATVTEDAAAYTCILQAVAAVATFVVVRQYTELAALQVHAAVVVVQLQLWAQQQTKQPQSSLAAGQPFLTANMLAVAATDTAEAGTSLQQALVAVFVLEINTGQSMGTVLWDQDRDCVILRLHVLGWCRKMVQHSLTWDQLLLDAVMLLVAWCSVSTP